MANWSEAEVMVLGSVLLTGGKCLDDLTLAPDEFFDPKHETAYRTMQTMWNNSEPVDTVTFVQKFERLHPNKIPLTDIHQWTSWVPTASNVEYYAQMVHEAFVRRQLLAASSSIAEATKTEEFSMLTEFARGKIDRALGIANSAVSFVYDELDNTIKSLSDPTPSFFTPWRGLDQAIGGWRPGALYVIGARPGRGKTSIAIQSALELGKQGTVAFSSLEMRREEIHKRIIAITASVPMDSLMNNKMTERDYEKWDLLKHKVRPAIAIDDRAEVTIGDIRTHARSVNRQGPLSGIVVDYLQLMTSRDSRPRHEIVAEFSRQLKILARDLNVPVIALSQLNRASEGRMDKKPNLADLRESGSIEQDADVVILLHLDEDGSMLLDVAKNRHGAQATVRLQWEGHYARAV